MSTQDFLASFHEIANAPSGVARLRSVVLQLAVTGHLADTDETDGTADSLNAEIQEARIAFAKSEGSKLASVTKTTPPAELEAAPEHWAWCKLGDLTTKIGSGSTPRGGSKVYVSKGTPFLRSQNVWNEGLRMNDVVYIPDDVHLAMRGTHVQANDILLNITGASLGRCSLVPDSLGPANVSQHVTIIRCALPDIRQFVRLCLLSPFGQAMIWGRQVGMAREGLSKKVLEQFEIPLPPLAEQKRIVAKVEELMALCDALEAQQQERDRLFPRLSRAIHTRLTDHPSQPHLDSLFTDLDSLSPEDMRRSIQSLAVLGKLAPQDPAEPALDRRQNYNPLNGEDVSPTEQFISDLPANWTWIRFEWLGEIFGGLTPSMAKSEFWHGDIPWVSPKDMHTKTLRSAEMHVTERALEQTSLKLVPPGSLLFVTRSGILRRTLPVALTEVECVVNQDLKVLVPHDSNITAYIQLLLRGFESLILTELVKTGTTVQSVMFDAFRLKAFPFPPLAEQRRIVAKVDELMALVDTVEAQQQEKSRLAEAFAQACVASITGTRIETHERMKAPKTRLVSRIRLGISPPDKAKAPLAGLIAKLSDNEMDAKALWQQSKLSIDDFYLQLRTELKAGWIAPPDEAQVLEVDASTGTAGFLSAALEHEKKQKSTPRKVLETMVEAMTGVGENLIAEAIDTSPLSASTKRKKRK